MPSPRGGGTNATRPSRHAPHHCIERAAARWHRFQQCGVQAYGPDRRRMRRPYDELWLGVTNGVWRRDATDGAHTAARNGGCMAVGCGGAVGKACQGVIQLALELADCGGQEALRHSIVSRTLNVRASPDHPRPSPTFAAVSWWQRHGATCACDDSTPPHDRTRSPGDVHLKPAPHPSLLASLGSLQGRGGELAVAVPWHP